MIVTKVDMRPVMYAFSLTPVIPGTAMHGYSSLREAFRVLCDTPKASYKGFLLACLTVNGVVEQAIRMGVDDIPQYKPMGPGKNWDDIQKSLFCKT